MIDTESIFRYKKLNGSKLTQYGFEDDGFTYHKEISIMKKQFLMSLSIGHDGSIGIRVTEADSGEEYTLINVDSAQGDFVGHVREACENVLSDVAAKCFDTEILKAAQTNRILEHIRGTYDVEPEFLWEKYPGYAAFRRQDNKKWFAIIMAVDRSKIGLSGRGSVEIIDLKAKPDVVSGLLEQRDHYPAYHMNKKHWFTICLDGSISDEELFELLESSFECALH